MIHVYVRKLWPQSLPDSIDDGDDVMYCMVLAKEVVLWREIVTQFLQKGLMGFAIPKQIILLQVHYMFTDWTWDRTRMGSVHRCNNYESTQRNAFTYLISVSWTDKKRYIINPTYITGKFRVFFLDVGGRL